MRQALILSRALLFWSAVRALPFGLDAILHVEERHVSVATIERRHPQGLLDGLSSFGDELSSAFSPETTSSSRATATRAATTSDDDDETTTSRATATTRSSSSARETTSTRRSTSEESSTTESSTTEETSTTESSTSETSTTPESTTSVPAETARASETPAASTNDDGNNVPVAGIVVGAVMGAALLGAIIFVLFKWGPLAKWRENRAYERMMERSYRPALDDKTGMAFNDNGGAGLGLAPMGAAMVSSGDGAPPNGGYRGVRPTTGNSASVAPSPVSTTVPQRAFSFTEAGAGGDGGEQERIRRKPLPTIGTGGGAQGASPLMGSDVPGTGADRAEPWLPGGAK